MPRGRPRQINQKSLTPREKRLEIIKSIEKIRGDTILICYLTSTRPNTGYQMADDAIRKIYDHLKGLAGTDKPKIDLFLYSSGGVGTVPWRLVNLIKEFSSKFEILIPYKAYSAATLTALGADKIWMHPMGELGPVDPKVGNEFNPQDNKGNLLGISVEDVASYVALIKETVGIQHEDELVQAFDILANKVHPLALGNVHRFMAQSKMIGRKLLQLHMAKEEEHRIEEIVDHLTAKLFFHGHPINRKEAKDLGLKIHEPDSELENMMWKLFEEYENEMELKSAFNPPELLNSRNTDQLDEYTVKGAYVESKLKTDMFVSKYSITRPDLPQGASRSQQLQVKSQAIVVSLKEAWEEES